jgi:hypothetical protein
MTTRGGMSLLSRFTLVGMPEEAIPANINCS